MRKTMISAPAGKTGAAGAMSVFVGLGGALGAVARLALGEWIARFTMPGMPWGTLAANSAGSLLLGWASRRLHENAATPHTRAFLMIGVCGGFTTFSAFDHELVTLVRDGRVLAGALYAVGTTALCILCVLVGRRKWRTG